MNALEKRRLELGMSRPALAQRSGVSIATLNRVLGDDLDRVAFRTVAAIADALGLTFQWKPRMSTCAFQHEQARQKAQKLAALVQGTSSLEGQAVDERVKREITNDLARRLVAGPKRRLWSG